jgi:cytoskeleton protein RodZ
LPGRTFVRGFVRNYARLVNLDPDAVVDALPSGEPTSPLERLTYTPSARPMGEMPVESSRRSGRTTRWLIPLVLLAVVAVAAYYEFSRQAQRPTLPDGIMPPAAQPAPAPAPPPTPSGTPLRNPLEAPKSEAAPPPSAAAADPAPAAPAAANDAPPAQAPAVAKGEAPLVLTFSGSSWVQVKDAAGTAVVSQTAPAGATIPVSGAPPLDVVVGNAERVTATLHGQPLDLGPYTRSNVARFTVK